MFYLYWIWKSYGVETKFNKYFFNKQIFEWKKAAKYYSENRKYIYIHLKTKRALEA